MHLSLHGCGLGSVLRLCLGVRPEDGLARNELPLGESPALAARFSRGLRLALGGPDEAGLTIARAAAQPSTRGCVGLVLRLSLPRRFAARQGRRLVFGCSCGFIGGRCQIGEHVAGCGRIADAHGVAKYATFFGLHLAGNKVPFEAAEGLTGHNLLAFLAVPLGKRRARLVRGELGNDHGNGHGALSYPRASREASPFEGRPGAERAALGTRWMLSGRSVTKRAAVLAEHRPGAGPTAWRAS